MVAISFPASPSVNDTFTANGKTWQWNGTFWSLVVSGASVADGSVSTAKIADSAITAAKIADGTVVAAEIANNAITTDKIAAGAVTVGKIADCFQRLNFISIPFRPGIRECDVVEHLNMCCARKPYFAVRVHFPIRERIG